MADCWIFTVKDDKIGKRKKKGTEIYKKRMSDAFWGLGESVANRSRVKMGNRVVFYLAGVDGQKFLGTCTLVSAFHRLGKQEREKLAHGPFFQATHGVNLSDIEVWDSPKPIHPLLKRLGIIKDVNKWGCYIQGSIIRTSEDDYNTIVSAHELEEIIKLSDMGEPNLTDESHRITVNRKARDSAFKEEIRKLYNCSCAVCGKKRFTNSNFPEVESAHIYSKRKDGSDDLRNGIALCKLHHWAFDGGLFSIRDDYSIAVENRIKGDDNYEEISSFENKKIRFPDRKEFRPHPIFLREHGKIHGFK